MTKLDWRSRSFTDHCNRLDLLYFHKRLKDNGFTNTGRGNFPEYRQRGGRRNQHTKSHAPKGLPINCYDQEWLGNLSPEQVADLDPKPVIDLTPTEEEIRYAVRSRDVGHLFADASFN